MRGGPALETEDDGDGYGLGSRLASREVDILTLVSGGLRNREIGDRLGLTEGTVKWYMQQIRSEEHTSELQSLMRISYAVFCLKKKTSNYNMNRCKIEQKR